MSQNVNVFVAEGKREFQVDSSKGQSSPDVSEHSAVRAKRRLSSVNSS
jgi:hypothetical protein